MLDTKTLAARAALVHYPSVVAALTPGVPYTTEPAGRARRLKAAR